MQRRIAINTNGDSKKRWANLAKIKKTYNNKWPVDSSIMSPSMVTAYKAYELFSSTMIGIVKSAITCEVLADDDEHFLEALIKGNELVSLFYKDDDIIEINETNWSSLQEKAKKARRAPLKPHQKLRILKEYLLPRLIASLQQPNITRKILKEADRKVRIFLRSILHLNAHRHNSILYAPVKEGGLGIFCLHERIPGILLQRINKLRESDEIFSALVKAENKVLLRIERMTTNISSKAANNQHHAAALNACFSGCNGYVRKGDHAANSKLCPTYKQIYKIEKDFADDQ
uniref:Uncharacterized protein n=1 Tax=Glossina brevipalpis TaxID=37001 RepID=A0A1A9WI03_9MUSC